MATNISIQLEGMPALRSAIQRAVDKLADPSDLMRLIGQTLETNTALRIDDYKADPSGHPWAKLKPSTQKAYARKYKGSVPGSLLTRAAAGGLRGTLTHALLSPTEVVVGFGVPYAMFHEFGTRKMVRRGLLTADPSAGTLGQMDQDDIEAEMNAYLQRLFD